MFLLDTHVWIWAVEGDARRIGARTRRRLATARTTGTIRVSAASAFEVAALELAGRLRLSRPTDTWVRDALDALNAELVGVSRPIALEAGRIPRSALADPMDRLVVATARDLDATLLTCDESLLGYAERTRNLRARTAAE